MLNKLSASKKSDCLEDNIVKYARLGHKTAAKFCDYVTTTKTKQNRDKNTFFPVSFLTYGLFSVFCLFSTHSQLINVLQKLRMARCDPRPTGIGSNRPVNYATSLVAAIAPWFCLRLPSYSPGFKSQAHHLRFFQFVLQKLYQENNENKQKRGRDWPIFFF